MFIILSQATFETSTDLVCKWLEYYNVSYGRINGGIFAHLKILDGHFAGQCPSKKYFGIK